MNELETYYPPPDERVFAIIPGLVQKLGWEPKMKAYLENFFSEQNRTPNWQDRGGLYSLLEPFFKMVANQTVEGVSGEFDPMGTVMGTYGGPNAKFPPKTGRFSNMADKMERFEISDRGAKIIPIDVSKIESKLQAIKNKLKPFDNKNEMWKAEARKLRVKQIDLENQLDELSNNAKFPDIMNHPALFKQYPFLKEVKVRTNPQLGEYSGAYSSEYNAIDLPNLKTPSKSTLIHEIQHAIQEREGFAKGGSPDLGMGIGLGDSWRTPQQKVADLASKMLVWEKEYPINLAKFIEEKGFTPEQIKQAKKLKESFPRPILKKMAGDVDYEAYKRLSGEIEARDAASRMNLTGQQRRKTAPYTSEDIPLSEWITRK